MQSIFDFLDFRLFISPAFLFVFYYLGALIMPFAGWRMATRIKQKYWLVTDAIDEIDSGDNKIFDIKVLSFPEKIRFMGVAVILFILLEIMWRMMFEFLMAYFQIHDALVG